NEIYLFIGENFAGGKRVSVVSFKILKPSHPIIITQKII
ncbi:MAG: hypothetical protein ACI9CQ_004104, partial [Saprospiraceae bacterium]